MTLPCLYIFNIILHVRHQRGVYTSDEGESGEIGRTRAGQEEHPIKRFKLRSSEKHTEHAGWTLFNALPASIKKSKNYDEFKIKLKTFLTDKCFYSVNDFKM